MSPLPTGLADNWPDDFAQFLDMLKLQASLIDQNQDRLKKWQRDWHVLNHFDIQPVDPFDALLKSLQEDCRRSREMINQLSNIVHLQDSNQQVMIAKLKTMLRENENANKRITKLEKRLDGRRPADSDK